MASVSRLRVPALPLGIRLAGVVLVAAVIVYFSLLDSPGGAGPLPMGPFGVLYLDKWLHALGYAALAGALGYAALSADARTLAGVLLLTVGFGVLMEVFQAPLPERAFSYADMAADAVGALAGLAAWRALAAAGLVDVR